jgi:AAA15 family ATPase/GTPase
MFENFKKIQIEGGYFEPSSGLDLFDSNQCLSIIYGRNGSGKTSIAKALENKKL